MPNYSYDPVTNIYTCNNASTDPHLDCDYVSNPCVSECYDGWIPYAMETVWNRDISIIIYGRIFPTLVGITVISNFFIVAVLSRPHMRTPTNAILFYMAIADLFVAVIPFPFCFHYIMLENYKHMDRLEAWWCWLPHFLTDALPPLFHNVAIWLTVLLAGQRLIYVQYPLSAQKWCTVAKVRWTTLGICLVSLLCASPKFLEIAEVRTVKYRVLNESGSVIEEHFQCINRVSALLAAIGNHIFYPVYFWTRVVFFVFIPSALLVVLSFFLIRAIQKANRRKERLLNQNRRSEANRQRESNSTTIMLFAIVVIFLIVNLPQGMILFIIIVYNSFGIMAAMDMNALSYAVHIDNMLILASYPLNFTIYCFMSAQFRQTFKRIFCCSSAPLPSRNYSTAAMPTTYVQLNGTNHSMQNLGDSRQHSMLELKGSRITDGDEVDLLI